MKIKLFFFLPFTFCIAIWQTIESIDCLYAINSPIFDGEIIRREDFRHFGGVPGGRLFIRIIGTDVVVKSEGKTIIADLESPVRFRYNGDPTRKVFIEGQEEPWLIALLFWVITIGAILYLLWPLIRNRNTTT